MSYLLHELLTESAEKYPENIAVKYRNSEISYKTLNLLSNQLCSCLMENGIQGGSRIGMYIDKSIDAVVSIFGVLKAGACYVPLDPLAPPARQLYSINDCSLKHLIVSSKKLFQLQQILQNKNPLKYIFIIDGSKKECKMCFPGINVIFKDDILKSQPRSAGRPMKSSNLAYILYTSGSTGRPKGVMITHKASFAFIEWAKECFNVKETDKISAHAPFHFDLSIFDIFVTIKAGATICIVPQGLSVFPQSLADFIEKEKISIWYSVPSVLIQLILYGNMEAKNLSFLKQVLYAGEEFPVKYLRKLMKLISHAKYYNLYGPAETNVCTYYPIGNSSFKENSVPIGKPIKGIEAFVANERGKLVDKEEAGELYISGSTLMQGYWNDPRKTETVLFKKSFFPARNVNVCRTGDMVKINENGDYVFLGRQDNMVKSRGYRIQLEEIELVLNEHPQVEKVAVVAIPDSAIGKKIKAIVVPKRGSCLTDKEIRAFCSQKLPGYMIPEIIEFKGKLPKTSSGKTNRTGGPLHFLL